MPRYVFQCPDGHQFEIHLKLAEAFPPHLFGSVEKICQAHECWKRARIVICAPTLRMGEGDNSASTTPKKFREEK